MYLRLANRLPERRGEDDASSGAAGAARFFLSSLSDGAETKTPPPFVVTAYRAPASFACVSSLVLEGAFGSASCDSTVHFWSPAVQERLSSYPAEDASCPQCHGRTLSADAKTYACACGSTVYIRLEA